MDNETGSWQEQNLIVDGYRFNNEADAQLARAERKKIEYIETHTDLTVPLNAASVYRKAIDQKLFKTPVGMEYLRHLRDILLEDPEAVYEDIPPIPLSQSYDVKMRSSYDAPKRPRERVKLWPVMSLVLNAFLIIAIVVMFIVSMADSNINAINYKNKVDSQNAAWAQELTQREEAVRSRERELDINE